jgi:hypothetical protein
MSPKSAPCELQQSRHNSHDVTLETHHQATRAYAHAHDAGGIKIVTLHRFTMEPTKEYNNHEDSTGQESKYTYKDPNHT